MAAKFQKPHLERNRCVVLRPLGCCSAGSRAQGWSGQGPGAARGLEGSRRDLKRRGTHGDSQPAVQHSGPVMAATATGKQGCGVRGTDQWENAGRHPWCRQVWQQTPAQARSKPGAAVTTGQAQRQEMLWRGRAVEGAWDPARRGCGLHSGATHRQESSWEPSMFKAQELRKGRRGSRPREGSGEEDGVRKAASRQPSDSERGGRPSCVQGQVGGAAASG